MRALFHSLLLAFSLFVFSEQSLAGESTSRSVLMMWEPNEAQRSGGFSKTVESQLNDLDVSLHLVAISSLPESLSEQIGLASDRLRPTEAIAIFWCDFSDRGKLYLYYHEEGVARLLVRDLAEPDWSSRGQAVAVIIRASMNEILAGAAIGEELELVELGTEVVNDAEKEASPEAGLPKSSVALSPASPPAFAPSLAGPGEMRRLGAEVAYVFYSHSRRLNAVHGVGIGLGYWIRPFLVVFAKYLVMQQMEERREELSLRLHRHPIVAGIRLWTVKEPFRVGFAASIVTDFAVFNATSKKYEIKENKDNMDVVPSASLALEVSYSLLDRFSLILSGGVEMGLHRIDYTVKLGAVKVVMIESFPVHPLLQIGFIVDLF